MWIIINNFKLLKEPLRGADHRARRGAGRGDERGAEFGLDAKLSGAGQFDASHTSLSSTITQLKT